MGWIAGPEETQLTVVWRGRDGRPHSADLERAMVPPETVFAQRSGDVLVIQVTAFNRSTDSHLAQAIEQGFAGPRPPEGIVLDLRGNRGGLLRQAVTAADTLLPAGVVAITAGRDPEATRVWRSNSGELAGDVPVVVMVDGRSASAAEILAAALADRGRGVVIGSSTLGKGLVQTIAPLPDGGELFVTWSRVLAPRGWPIQGLGVLPQVCTSLGQDTLSWQLAALAQGQQTDGEGAGNPPRRQGTASAGADPGNPQCLSGRRGSRGGPRYGAAADPRPRRLRRRAAAAVRQQRQMSTVKRQAATR